MSNALDTFLGQKFSLAITGRATRLSVYNGFAFRHRCLLTLELLMRPLITFLLQTGVTTGGSKRLPRVPVRIRLLIPERPLALAKEIGEA